MMWQSMVRVRMWSVKGSTLTNSFFVWNGREDKCSKELDRGYDKLQSEDIHTNYGRFSGKQLVSMKLKEV